MAGLIIGRDDGGAVSNISFLKIETLPPESTNIVTVGLYINLNKLHKMLVCFRLIYGI
jgi:hypothetical protein